MGLTCGGILDVYVEKVVKGTFPELGAVAADIEAGRPVAVATVIEHPDPAWLGRRLVVHPEDEEDEGTRVNAEAGASSAAYGNMSSGSDRADDAVRRRRAKACWRRVARRR